MGSFQVAWCSKLVESWKWYNDPSKSHSMNTKSLETKLFSWAKSKTGRYERRMPGNPTNFSWECLFFENKYKLVCSNQFLFPSHYKITCSSSRDYFLFFFLFSLALHVEINIASVCLLSFDRYVVYVFIRGVNNFWNSICS